VDLQVNFQWYVWPPFAGMPQLFTARWTGVLVPDVTVDYLIGVSYDAGAARHVHNTTICFAAITEISL
jgi:hypothetical protein